MTFVVCPSCNRVVPPPPHHTPSMCGGDATATCATFGCGRAVVAWYQTEDGDGRTLRLGECERCVAEVAPLRENKNPETLLDRIRFLAENPEVCAQSFNAEEAQAFMAERERHTPIRERSSTITGFTASFDGDPVEVERLLHVLMVEHAEVKKRAQRKIPYGDGSRFIYSEVPNITGTLSMRYETRP